MEHTTSPTTPDAIVVGGGLGGLGAALALSRKGIGLRTVGSRSTRSVDLASMCDSHDQHNKFVIFDCVDDSVIADSNPPKSVVAD